MTGLANLPDCEPTDDTSSIQFTTTGKVSAQFSQVIPKVSTRKTHTMIWVTFQKKGFHCYPGAPDDVAYLKSHHRHLFKFKVGVEVAHSDRDIEFHQFLNWLESLYDTKTLELDFKSCEMLAEDILASIISKYNCSNRRIEITISEDDECGATLVSMAV